MHSFRSTPIGGASLVFLLALGCDRLVAPATEPAPSPAASATAAPAAPAATAAAPTVAAAVAPPTVAPPAAAPPDCAALAKHVDAVLRATGTALEKSSLLSVDAAQRLCEGDRNDPTIMACFLAATDSAGFAKCNRDAFPGEVDAKPVRKFNALRDNKSVSPPVLTQDGDYLAYDDHCGMLFKEVAPAGAFYIACKGKIEIGPLVTADEVDRVVKSLAAQEDQRHRMVMNLIDKAAVGDFRVPVHVYNSNGSFRGIEYR